MKSRLISLLAIALVGVACIAFCGYWASVLASSASEAQRDRAEYYAGCWLVGFGVVAGVWIWLLVKTVRKRSEEQL